MHTARSPQGASLTFLTLKDAETFLWQAERLVPERQVFEIDGGSTQPTVGERLDLYLNPGPTGRLSPVPLRASTLRGYRHLAKNYLSRELSGFVLTAIPIRSLTRVQVREWMGLLHGELVTPEPTHHSLNREIRLWARSQGIPVTNRGAIPVQVREAWERNAADKEPRLATPRGQVQIAQAYRLLRAICNVAIDDGLITVNPCRIPGAGSPHHPERRTASLEEITLLANEVPQRYRAAIFLAAFSSMRSGELFGLQRRNVNVAESCVTVEHQLSPYASDSQLLIPTKSAASRRTIYLPEPIMKVLEAHLKDYTEESDSALVFTTSTGKPIFKGRKSWFITAKRRLNLDHLTFHDLRHTGQTLALAQGATIKDLQRRAGQSSDRAARLYLHGSSQRDRIIADSLSAAANECLSRLME